MKPVITLTCLLAVTGCGPQAEPDPIAETPVATATPAPAPAAPAAPVILDGPGPVDGVWRCSITGDIPIGTLTFKGAKYRFQTTDANWRPDPSSSDGSGVVIYDETAILPQDGPLNTEFKATGAFGDKTFLTWTSDRGLIFGCRPK